MPPRARLYLPVLTHGAALLAGVLICSHLRPAFTGSASPPAPAAAATSSAIRTPEQILKDATPVLSKAEADAARREKNLAALREAIRTLQIPADMAAAMDAEAADWLSAKAVDPSHFSPRFAALLYHWLLTDPEAFNKWHSAGEPGNIAVSHHLGPICLEVLKQPEGAEILTTRVPAVSPALLGIVLGREPDADLLANIQSHLKPAQQKRFLNALAIRWPEDRRQELIDLAVAQKRPEMLTIAFESENTHWLADLSKDPGTPADFRAALAGMPGFAFAIGGDSSVPLEQRLSYFGGAGDTAYDRIAALTLDQMGKDGLPDWAGQIEAGQTTAGQVLDSVSQAAPELTAAAPDALREKVFQQLLLAGAADATDLLAGLPEDRRAQVILDSVTASDDHSGIPPLDVFARVMALLPDDPAIQDQRLAAWGNAIKRNLSHAADENVSAWIEALPPGPDREIALAYGVLKFQTTNPELSARLHSRITDPRLTPPPGE